MTDPIGANIAARSLNQAAQLDPTDKLAGPAMDKGPGGAYFKDVLQQKQVEAAGQVDAPSEVAAVEAPAQVEAPSQVEAPAHAQMENFVRGIMTDERELERMMAR